jgi:hypothetical protein
VLILKYIVLIRDWRLPEEIHLAFPFLKLAGGSGGMELVWCIG